MKINVMVSSLGAYTNGKLTGKCVNLPVDDVKKDILDQINGAEGDEFFITDYTAPFTIGEYTSLTDLNKLAKALNDEEIDTLEDLYWYVIENCDISAIDLPFLYLYDEDEAFNRLMEDRTPIEIATSIGHLVTSDEYLYFDGYNRINSMNKAEFETMLSKSADDLINLFALDHEISSFE